MLYEDLTTEVEWWVWREPREHDAYLAWYFRCAYSIHQVGGERRGY